MSSANTLLLEVVTPQGLAVKAEVDQVEAPSVQGEFGVLPGHLPLLVALRAGVLRYRSAGKTVSLAVGPGFAEAGPSKMTVLTDMAMQGADVDTAAARADRDDSQKKIDTWANDTHTSEYEELVRDRDWVAAQIEAARESGKS